MRWVESGEEGKVSRGKGLCTNVVHGGEKEGMNLIPKNKLQIVTFTFFLSLSESMNVFVMLSIFLFAICVEFVYKFSTEQLCNKGR